MKRLQKDRKRINGRPFSLFALAMCAALLSFASCRAFPQAASAAPKTDKPAATGNVQNGKTLYTSVGCYECHGRVGQGGPGPRLGPRAVPLALLLNYVRRPVGEMPPYTSKVLSDAELTDIFAFLQSLPEPPKLADIPLLKE